MRKSTSGFTLVELLIVIVVIAILAAISVVAYSGIQERANASNISSSANGFIKLLTMYKVEHGEYPSSVAGNKYASHGTNDVCYGAPSDFPATDGFDAEDCLRGTGSYRVAASQTFYDSLAKYGKPTNPQMQPIDWWGDIWRGIRYSRLSSPSQAVVDYIMKGDFEDLCPGGPGSSSYYDSISNVTSCAIQI